MNLTESQNSEAVFKAISKDRHRTNILRKYEQKALVYLVQRIPSFITSDILTGIGFIGSLITVFSFILATYIDQNFLLLGILGFFINWFGDSMDGRVAYYRNTPRKWYGFSLDITVDWLTTMLIGYGYMVYTEGSWEMLGFVFVVMYGWAIITALLRYKVTGKYTIDSGLFGPTEARIVISAILIGEVLYNGSIVYSALAACIILFIINVIDTRKLICLANDRDLAEKQK
jgi:hypothetical protein